MFFRGLYRFMSLKQKTILKSRKMKTARVTNILKTKEIKIKNYPLSLEWEQIK